MLQTPLLVPATCVAIDGQGVLLRGASGSGKSDLALRLIDSGAALVADDQVEIAHNPNDGRLYASPPAPIAGKIEARYMGILTLPHVHHIPLRLIVDAGSVKHLERLPLITTTTLLGATLPQLFLPFLEASTTSKIRLFLQQKGALL